jgi:dolichyl-phosphate-mannose--protein O-mannosyl transferase
LFAYLLGLALFESPWWAGLGALLLAFDGLHLVLSRMAMLDVFVSTFVTLGALLLALDRIRGPSDPTGRTARWFGSGYRLSAGLALGAAFAVKWSGGLALLLAAILCATGFLDHDRAVEGQTVALRKRVKWMLAAFVLVPTAVYLVSYVQFWLQHGPALGSFAVLQWRMLQFQLHDTRTFAGTSNTSNPLTWPLLLHPVQFIGLKNAPAGSSPILGLGNPIVWWGFLVLLPVAFVSWLRRAREWRTGLLLAFFGVMYAPWLFVGRVQYLFYMLPAVPFMCLISARGLRTFPGRARNAFAAGYAALAVTAGIAFLPVWLGFNASWSGALGWLPGWR